MRLYSVRDLPWMNVKLLANSFSCSVNMQCTLIHVQTPTVDLPKVNVAQSKSGGNVTLDCMASSEEPGVIISWTTVDVTNSEIKHIPPRKENVDGNSIHSVLTLTDVTEAKSVNYTCTATNRRGNNSDSKGETFA